MTDETQLPRRSRYTGLRTTSIAITGVLVVLVGGFGVGVAGFADVTGAVGTTAAGPDDGNLTDLTPTGTATGDPTDITVTEATEDMAETPTAEMVTSVGLIATPTGTMTASPTVTALETPTETPIDTAVPTAAATTTVDTSDTVEVTNTVHDANVTATVTDADRVGTTEEMSSNVVGTAKRIDENISATPETGELISDITNGSDETVSSVVGTTGGTVDDTHTSIENPTKDTARPSVVEGTTAIVDATRETVDGPTDAVSVDGTAVVYSMVTQNAGESGSGSRSVDSAEGDGPDIGPPASGGRGTLGPLQDGWMELAANDIPLSTPPAGAGLVLVGVLASAAAARIIGAVGGTESHAVITAESLTAVLRVQLFVDEIRRRLRRAVGVTPLVVSSRSLQVTGGNSSVLQWLVEAIRSGLDRASRIVPIPGYSRYDDSDPLENDVRRAVYEEVNDAPGVYRTDVAERVGVSLSTVRYHARILREEGLIEEAKIRGKRRLFPAITDGPDAALAAALDDDPTAAVLGAVARLEPASTSEVADELDRSPSTVSYHLDRLADEGLVTRNRDGKAVVVTLEPEVRSALASDGETAAKT